MQAEERLLVEAQAAHVFMVSEEMEPLKDVELAALIDSEQVPVELVEDPANNCLVGDVTALNGASLFTGHRKPQIWSDTTDDVQEGDRETLEAKGYKVLSVGKYEKFAKLLLKEDVNAYKKVLGDPLEIELLTNPATVKPGDEIVCRILWQGKPFKTEVSASFDGFSQEDDVYAVQTESTEDGIAKFKVEHPGLWFIRVGNTDENVDDADKWVVRATYTFEIR